MSTVAVCSLILVSVLGITLAQTVLPQNQSSASLGTDLNVTTVQLATLITTASVAPTSTMVDGSLPIPRDLFKVSARTNTITLKFQPPSNYKNDARYSHFRIEFERDGRGKMQFVSIPKNSSLNNVVVSGLQGGVLYRLVARSQGRDVLGNYLLSFSSRPIMARTKPPPVSNLRVVRKGNSITEALVIWDSSPTPFNGPKYDNFSISFEITNKMTTAQEYLYRRYPISVRHKFNALNVIPPKNVNITVDNLQVGATYRFSVVTESFGEDPTTSIPITNDYVVAIPGPENVKKLEYSNTTITVSWQISKDLTGITENVINYYPIKTSGSLGTISRDILLESSVKNYTFTDLEPGTLYYIVISSRIDGLFGKITSETTMYARTAPSLPVGTEIGNVSPTSIAVNLNLPDDIVASSVFIEYTNRWSEETGSMPLGNFNIRSVLIERLQPGALYYLIITVVSRVGLETDETESSIELYARTTPNPPKDFAGRGTEGKVYLNWLKPDGLRLPTIWRYEIIYYPKDNPSQISKQPLWNRDGANKMSTSLDDLLPGTLYEILLYCDVGEDAEGDRKARSSPAGPLEIYTQPQNPVISSWQQVTLTRVKLEWKAPGDSVSNFDYYLLNLTRKYVSASAIEYQPESFSYDVSKYDTSKILKLTAGGSYRVTLTTVVGSGDTWMESVTVVGINNREYETWSPYDSHQLFSRLSWTFTNCDELGRFGPNQIFCNFAYEETSLANLVRVEEGIQYWLAPIQGLYRITAVGAGYQGTGGKGATVSGLFHLKDGAGLKIAVGQQGNYDGMTRGGAGGSFVVADDHERNEPMVIAGGAGSVPIGMQPSSFTDGRLNHTAGDASSVGQGFGYGGSREIQGPGLPGVANTGGGAGFRGISRSALRFGDIVSPAVGFLPFAGDENVNETEKVMYIPLAGGRYESEDGSYSEGGFGGGGSGYYTAAGGGGGYTGGGGGPAGGYSGGGGSYIKFTGGIQHIEVTNDGPGRVEITLVGLPVSTPIPVTLYLIVAFFVGVAMTLCFGGMLYGIDKCVGNYVEESHSAQIIANSPMITSSSSLPTASPPPIGAGFYETSVNVTSNSPSTSGLYVRGLAESDTHSYRKYSEVDSDQYIPGDISPPTGFRNISKSKSPIRKTMYETPILYESEEEEDAQTESTASTISSMKSGIEITEHPFEWEDEVVEESDKSSFDGDPDESEDSDQRSELSSLPPPPPPPPIAVDDEHQERFQKRLQMFNDIQYRPSTHF